MERRFYQKKRNYFIGLLFLILLFLVIVFVRTVSKGQLVTEFSSEYVALAELPSQLSFTYYGANL